jgi:hypothetical protein
MARYNTTTKTKRQSRHQRYTKKHYNSLDGMLTYIWGPPMWHYLHTMSFNYPVTPTAEDKKHYRSFVLSLKYVLPCGKCRENFAKNLKKVPPVAARFKSRAAFSRYIYDLHETVNTMLGKTSGLSFAQVRDRYENFRARCYLGNTSDASAAASSSSSSSSSYSLEKSTNKSDSEVGCVNPVHGNKTKCVMKIVPLETKCPSMEV